MQDQPELAISDPNDPFEVGTGPFYIAGVNEAEPRIVLPVERRHCNSSGVVHGGLLMTMADLAMCWMVVRDSPGERAVTVSLHADFVAAGQVGDRLEARAEVIRRTGSLAFLRGQITVGNRILLSCSAVVKRVRRD